MEPWEVGDEVDEERVCDECAGYDPSEDELLEIERQRKLHGGGARRRRAQRGVAPVVKMLDVYQRALTKDPNADVRELKDSIDYHISLLNEKEQKELEPVLKKMDYVPATKKKGAQKSMATGFAGKVTTIPIGPTTTTDEIYEMVDEAMTAIANGRFDAFKLGAYLVVWEGTIWVVFREGSDTSLASYPDKQRSVYTIVDDWMNDKEWHIKGR